MTIPIHVETLGRACAGCTKCCEGWLTTKVYDFEIGPGIGGCRFLNKGCGIYQARPYDPCKVFQCGWKENDRVPYFMKPDISGVILLVRYIEDIYFYRIVKCGDELNPIVVKWAQEYSQNNNHLIAYDKESKLLIFSQSRRFRELARKHYTLGGVL